jgi:hypothetical protein
MSWSATKLSMGLIAALIGGTPIHSAPPSQADPASGQDAKDIVKAMSAYLASQSNLSGDFDAALDVVTPQLERVTFDASGSLLISRPDKIRATRKGGYSEMELLSDGKTATVIDRVNGAYSQAKSPGNIDSLVDMLEDQYGVDMPAADLLMTNSYDRLMHGVVEAKHIGVGVIDGQDCEHLAFRNADTDWQLWVRTGDRPLPCKYVISSKTVVGYPTYTIRFRNWSTGQAPPGNAFTYTPAAGAKQVGFDKMSAIREIPPPAPAPTGGR